MSGSDKDGEGVSVEYELLRRSVGWFTLHKIGNTFCRIIFSHGLLVFWITALIGFLCHNANRYEEHQKAINFDNRKTEKEVSSSECILINNITQNTEATVNGEKTNHGITKSQNNRNKVRRNECPILN